MSNLSAVNRTAKQHDRLRALEVAADMAKALGKKKQAAKIRKLYRARKERAVQ